ncbi:hypothetical protein EDB89DRAFT_495011 [Lactarius sanguifluus]|nr:hypothetical protein EDB89DRAFT_495011 [Lactarius sanguifluus]
MKVGIILAECPLCHPGFSISSRMSFLAGQLSKRRRGFTYHKRGSSRQTWSTWRIGEPPAHQWRHTHEATCWPSPTHIPYRRARGMPLSLPPTFQICRIALISTITITCKFTLMVLFVIIASRDEYFASVKWTCTCQLVRCNFQGQSFRRISD